MRISTQQFYFQSSLNMTTQNSKINQQVPYLSSSKRVLTAKDDAIAYGTLSGYKNELMRTQQYQRNIIQAKNKNGLIETSFSSVTSALLQVKQAFIQGNNSSLTDSIRTSLADQVQQNRDQILNIANSKDANGSYVFSGYQADKKPFTVQPDNSVLYQGDSGVNKISIANNVNVNLNQAGDHAFTNVGNTVGDFTPDYQINTGGVTVKSAVISNRGNYDTATYPPGYSLNFTDTNGDGKLEVAVKDATSTTVTTINPFVSGKAFNFNGVDVTIDGTPNVGDKINLKAADKVSLFDTLKAAIDWLKLDTKTANSSQRAIDYGHILSQLNTASNYISTRQSEAGINLKLIDTQNSAHEDNKLYLEKGRSSIEDLDYASAISKFEQSKVALQASQATFSKIQGLSLFKFI